METAANEWTAAAPGRSRNETAPGFDAGREIELRLHRCWDNIASLEPIRFGVPFARGAHHKRLELKASTKEDESLPAQTQILERWPDGSIRWLLVDILLPRQGCAPETIRLTPCEPRHENECRIEQQPDGSWKLGLGDFAVTLSAAGQTAALSLAMADKELLEIAPLFSVRRLRGRRAARPILRYVVPETIGCVRTRLRFAGRLRGLRPIRFYGQINLYPSAGLVGLDVVLFNPARARHRAGLWDLGDPSSILLADVSVNLAARLSPPIISGRIDANSDRQVAKTDFTVCQYSSGRKLWNSPNHMNRHGIVDLQRCGYEAIVDGCMEQGTSCQPVVSLANKSHWLTAAIPEFWQQFPKLLSAQAGSVRWGLLPEEAGCLYELQPGERKTFSCWLAVGQSGGGDPLNSLAWLADPIVPAFDPNYLASTNAISWFAPAPQPVRPEYESILHEAINGPFSLEAKRDQIDEFGWRNFGDLVADHENAYYDGPKPVVSHYNNQYDALYGLLLQYWRSGDPRWWRLADPLARHVSDIDIYHSRRDKSAYSGGLFWHTAHYLPAETATHRCYSKRNLGRDRKLGGGPSNEHNYSTGLFHYFLMTGDIFVRDSALELAHWVRRAEDGRTNPLGVIEPGPTGWGTHTFNWYGPGRGAGNSVNSLLDAFRLSGDRNWLNLAEALLARTVHPSDDPEAEDLGEPEFRWSYTVFLLALIRYLDLKTELGETDEPFAYGRTCLERYARWMAEHEKPFFDQKERLEYPTETWPAQDIRKAVVMYLARSYVKDAELRAKLQERADWISDRAWRDLGQSSTKSLTRPVVLTLSLGIWEEFAKSRNLERGCSPLPEPRLPAKIPFRPQRERVKQLLRSPKKLLGALPNAFDCVPWWESWRRSWTAELARRGRDEILNWLFQVGLRR